MPFTPADPVLQPDSDTSFPDGRVEPSGLFFIPPIELGTPPVLPETTGVQMRLFRYFRPLERGINVFKLVGGRYTTIQPYPYEDIDIWYLGGHVYEVSFDEATSLVNAGYEVQGFTPGSGSGTPGHSIGDMVTFAIGDLTSNTIGDFV